MKIRRPRRRWLFMAALLLALIAYYPLLVLSAAVRDLRPPLPPPAAGRTDQSRMSEAQPQRVVVPAADYATAVAELQQLVREAAASGQSISLSGSAHSMGGHTLNHGGWWLNLRVSAFQQIEPVRVAGSSASVRVGAGTTWQQLIAALDREGWSVAIMQSNNDFTVGGSLSVNCHGWQHNAPPIGASVLAFRLLKADGNVVECRRGRAEDAELFGAVLGGYGLFGIILEAELQVTPNVRYRAVSHPVTADNYAARFAELLPRGETRAGMAYGRISVAPGGGFLRDGRIVTFLRPEDYESGTAGPRDTLTAHIRQEPVWLRSLGRAVFRASVGSGIGKRGRWALEQMVGERSGGLSRNEILQDPSEWFTNRDPAATEILHEYFVPPSELAGFLADTRALLLQRPEIDLLNITVRNVLADHDSVLPYAPADVFGLVMFFYQPRTPEGEEAMRSFTSALIDVVLRHQGRYYLPYRPHATLAQFRQAYPESAEFRRRKLRHDPQEVFRNAFYERYLRAR